MIFIKNYSEFSDEEVLTLIDCIARKRDLPKANEEFERQIKGKRVESTLLIRFALDHRDEIIDLRQKYNEQIDDLPGSTYREHLELYFEIYTAAKKEKVIGSTASGEDIIRQELAVAKGCVDGMVKVRMAWDAVKIAEKRIAQDNLGYGSNDPTQKGPTLSVQVMHSKPAPSIDPLLGEEVEDDEGNASDLGMASE